METNYSKRIDAYADEIAFYNVAARRHINMEDIEKLGYFIIESEYSNKLRKINRNRKKLKIRNTSQTLANSEK